MPKNQKFEQNEIVRFIKKSLVYNTDDKTEFYVPAKTTAKIIIDEDTGEIGSCKLKLKKKDGSIIVVEASDQFLEKIK